MINTIIVYKPYLCKRKTHMALPTNRDQLKEYCLRNLGKPVIDINVDDEQLEDRINEAIAYYRDYHFDGTERVFYKHQLSLIHI